jgi:hypothetical protein
MHGSHAHYAADGMDFTALDPQFDPENPRNLQEYGRYAEPFLLEAAKSHLLNFFARGKGECKIVKPRGAFIHENKWTYCVVGQ